MNRNVQRNTRRALLGLVAATLLAGCGFKLRGSAELPFESLHLDAGGAPSIAIELERNLRYGAQTRLTAKPEEAEAQLILKSEYRDKRILSIGGTGRVREYQLVYQVRYQLVEGRSKKALIDNGLAETRRDFTYDDSRVLAKEAEEQLLVRDMHADTVQQIMRRLAAIKRAAVPAGPGAAN